MTFAGACLALFALGHVVRDGWPAWKTILGPLVGTPFEWVYHLSTQLARISGAAVCGLGAWMVHDWTMAAAIGVAVLAGFYVDMKHGDGQGASSWDDAGYLSLSGLTSLIPLALLAVFLRGEHAAFIVFAGFAKVPIWFGWWALEGKSGRITAVWPWGYPTRLAAMTFGAVVGGLSLLIH